MTEPWSPERQYAMLEHINDSLTMIYDALKMQLSETDPEGLKELEYVHNELGIPLSQWDQVMPEKENDADTVDGI